MIRSDRRLLRAGAALALLVLLCSTALPVEAFVQLPSKERMQVHVTGAKNFGSEVVFDKVVSTGVNSTAGDALEQAAQIDLSGDYIESIAGIKGNQQVYWFYYINGLLSKVFAYGYKLQPGDVETWDFHDWTFYSMGGPSAVLGAFPEPCLHGYRGKVAPTAVVYAPEFAAEARQLGDRLTALGVAGVALKDLNALTDDEKQRDNLFIIATADQPLIASVNQQLQAHEPAYIAGNQIRTRDLAGKDAQTYGAGYGLLDVIQSPWNPLGSWACQNAVWAVTGLDAAGVRRAARVLTGFPAELSRSFALVVGQGEVIRTPIPDGGPQKLAMNTEGESSQQPVQQTAETGTTQEKATPVATAGPATTPAGDSQGGPQQPPAPAAGGGVARYWWALLPAAAMLMLLWWLIRRRHRLKAEEAPQEQELI